MGELTVESHSGDRRLAPEHAVLYTVAAIFLTILAPFGTDADLTAPLRFVYWFGVVFGGAVIAFAFSSLFQRHARKRGRLGYGLVTVMQLLVASVPITLLVGAMELWLRDPIRWAQLPQIYPYVLTIVAVITSASLFVRRHRALRAQLAVNRRWTSTSNLPTAPPANTRFHRRLEPGLRCEEINLLRADDHHLHVSTRKGAAVIRCALSVAIDEMGPVDGQQVHRSFWVARSAIRAVKRHGNAYRIVMLDGTSIPLSRRRYRELSRSDWLPV